MYVPRSMSAVPRDRVSRLEDGSGSGIAALSQGVTLSPSASEAWSARQHRSTLDSGCPVSALTCSGDNEGDAREGKKRRAGLRSSNLESRLVEVEAGASVSTGTERRSRTRRNSFRAREGG